MNVRSLVGLPVAVMALMPVFAVSGMATAQARPAVIVTYSCTAETWAGDQLPAVQVEARKVRQAQGVAQTEWRGTAKFATIVCKPV